MSGEEGNMTKRQKSDHTIVGIHITDRGRHAGEVQRALTEHGGRIKTRLGLHEVSADHDSPEGIMLLEVVGSARDVGALTRALSKIEGIEVQKMVFRH
jgi:hypothetical protein